MKERPILFNAEMVKAILSGRKTQTRRVVKFPLRDVNMGCELAGNELAGEVKAGDYRNCPLGQPGEQFWVRETWQVIHDYTDEHGNVDERRYARSIPKQRGNYWHPVYAASWGNERKEDREFPWRPSIHMPRWASRIDLLITGVRVERLNDISVGDVMREGCSAADTKSGYCVADVFVQLWESIYGERSWQANPWVWVIEFERVAPAGERS